MLKALYALGLTSAAWATAVPDLAPRTACESFARYSTHAQGTPSQGPLGLPYMRPPAACRTFNSSAVERVVARLTARMKDRDLARLFENTFPNTLDTTIRWFGADLAFVVTGDIPAEWLRDSSNQFKVYLPLVGQDAPLRELTRGVINLQARYITQYPYCNAFQPPPESGLPPQWGSGDAGAKISPPDDMKIVWTCGYELDSLLSFLQLSRGYFEFSQDRSIFSYNNGGWLKAVESVLQVIQDQAVPTYDPLGNVVSFYNISGPNQRYMKNNGRGPPKALTGLIGTTYRPSDDVVAFPYNIPHQAMAVVELRGLAALLKQVKLRPDLQKAALARAADVEAALWKWGTVLTKDWGEVFAYEVDGYGGVAIQDDANVPSLVSIPYLGFTNATNEIYANTRKMLLSTEGNPYYSFGPVIRGVSSPHIDEKHVWPMGLISEVVTSTDDADILVKLEYLKNTTTGLGLMHESVNTHDVTDYTRPWFAWANSYFAEAILQLAEKKPHLLFEDGKPFRVADVSGPELPIWTYIYSS
ncbi:Six-hairpin glycosidase-like protein [Mycena belliarum]|uniref:Six-hairpin glycosidase-like protein n=1 Tax=Mycena belliarum TaxID=1033014 RepID=A0AAD6TW90_9AGAR|nr:Six-hairpin glycosidase-like protein [Mycena belliae]